MSVVLQVIPGCPNTSAARALLQQALLDAGLPADQASVQVVEDDEQARRAGFHGSPTFLVDGADPFTRADAPPGLTCRLYPTADGLQPVPDRAALVAALRRVAPSRGSDGSTG